MTGTNAAGNGAANENDSELLITRVFNAPRDLVFKVWTDPDHLKHWWGPKGFTFEVATMDLRPGGVFHYGMRSPEGYQMWGKFVYREIRSPELLVFVSSFSDAEGNLIRHPMSPTWPLEVQNSLTFDEQDGKTTLTMRGGPINASQEERETFDAARGSVRQGFGGTFQQLDEYLAELI